MGLLLIALLLPVLIGFTFLSLLWPASLRSHLWLKLCLAVGVGFGLFSLLFFLFLVLFGASRQGLILTAACLLLTLVTTLGYHVKTGKLPTGWLESSPAHWSKHHRILGLLFLLVLASSLVAFIFVSLKNPHGDWDAWAVHNMRARFLFRAGDQWRDAYSDLVAWPVLDYPLLISAAIAGCWTLIGDDTVLVPILFALLFTFATVGLAASALALLRNRAHGYLAGVILLCTPLWITQGASQYLDVPLGFFFLATLVLLHLHDRFSGTGFALLSLAGLTAGLAAWTKNEGVLFVVVILLTRFAVVGFRQGLKRYAQQTLAMATGLALPLLVLFYFKLRLAPPSGLFTPRGQSTMEKLVDLSRYAQIYEAFKNQALGFGGWSVSILVLLIFYVLLLGIRVGEEEKSSLLASVATLVLMMAGYFFIFVITPYELGWHLLTSLNRLFLQLFPSFVFVCFFLARQLTTAARPRRRTMAATTES